MAIPCLHQLLSKSRSSSLKRKLDISSLNADIVTKKIRNDLSSSSTETTNQSSPTNTSSSSGNSCDKSDIDNDDPNVQFIGIRGIHNYLSQIYNFRVISDEESAIPIFSHDKTLTNSQLVIPKKNQHAKQFSIKDKLPKQILHEYATKFLKQSIEFKKKEGNWQTNRANLYAEVLIGDRKIGIGSGGTWKIAMQDAASNTLEIIDPNLVDKEFSAETTNSQVFDKFDICDCQLSEKLALSGTISTKSPYKALIKLLERHEDPSEFSISDIQLTVSQTSYSEENQYEYSMRYKDHVVKGLHDKKDCKNMAAQHMIKLLYPAMKTWGSVVRLSNVKWKKFQNKIPQISTVETSSNQTEESPSTHSTIREHILSKLQTEMRKQQDG